MKKKWLINERPARHRNDSADKLAPYRSKRKPLSEEDRELEEALEDFIEDD